MKLDIEFKDDKIGPVGSAGSAGALPTDESDCLSSSSEGDLRATRRQKVEQLDYRVRDQVSQAQTGIEIWPAKPTRLTV